MLEKKSFVDQVMYDARIDQISVREVVMIIDGDSVISQTYNRYWVSKETDIKSIKDENVLKAYKAYFA